MVHLVVVEKNITQHLWIAIIKRSQWCIAVLKGFPFIPTAGIQTALESVYICAKKMNDEA